MDSPIRTVLGPDGMHMEQEFGTMRWDVMTGEMSTVFGALGDGLRMVTRPNGETVTEQQVGNVRFSPDRGTETIF